MPCKHEYKAGFVFRENPYREAGLAWEANHNVISQSYVRDTSFPSKQRIIRQAIALYYVQTVQNKASHSTVLCSDGTE